ncbi:MAG: crossover junction endodeoxyribonuclease RuvC, partial [Opitutales bacterium]|nr:crossover junction endodeoxyribonuclease RuvC [Opitutales bacterium]
MSKNSRVLWAKKLASVAEKSGNLQQLALPARKMEFSANRGQFYGTVLGIDPSLRGTGLAVVKYEKGKTPVCLDHEIIRNKVGISMPQCLANIFRCTTAMVIRNNVDCVAIESSIYVQNTKTAVILGSARGAAIAAIACEGLPLFEYAPLRIKQAVVGFGRASKEQVAKTVAGILHAQK